MNGFFQLIRNLGPARLLTLALIAAGTIAFFYYLANKVNAPEMGLLYSDLDLKDSGQIVQKLETLNVPYELRAQGSQILVPVDQATKLRMSMAELGIPHGGSVGYEIFDKTDQFGPSQFVENINQVRALEGELERTIDSLSLVQSARVHLVLPQRALFSRDRQEATASIVLKVRGKLSSGQVAAVQHLVAAAVPDLNPNRVSVVDDQGNLLARGDGDAATALNSSNAEEMRVNYENRMARNVEQLLERSVGAGKARVDVHAEMNFDRTTTNSETYDPDGQVVRSTQNDNQSDSSGNAAGSAVSVSTNLPNGQTAPASATTGGGDKQTKSTHTQETVNYEISKTIKSQISDQGTVKRLSVAVLVDGVSDVGADGKKTYKPRSADELKQLTTLVRSAVGYDEKRGDTVEVVNMPFAGAEEPPAAPAVWNLMGLEKSDLLYLGTTAGTALIGLLILMLVIKPMIGRFLDTAKNLGGSAMPALAVAGAPATALPAPGGTAVARVPQPPQGEMIDIGQVEGRVAASSIKKIGEIVDKHPDEAVAIVRSWMYQDN